MHPKCCVIFPSPYLLCSGNFFQARDTGVYECQVNTEPKRSLAFFLRVVGELYLF